MGEGGDAFAGGVHLGEVNVHESEAGVGACVGQDFAPGRDGERMAVGAAVGAGGVVRVQARLRGGEDEAARLDRAGADQGFPMRGAGDRREGGGGEDDLRARLGEYPVEVGKADVVADGETECRKGGAGDHGAGAGAVGGGFAIRLGGGDVDVEHVDLVVAGGDLAVGRDQVGAVGETAVGVGGLDAEGTDGEPDVEGRGLGAQGGEGGVCVLGVEDFGLAGAVRGHAVRDFGRADKVRACRVGLTHHGADGVCVFRRGVGGGKLEKRGFHG